MAKATVMKKTIKDPELIDMFNQMVGASDPDIKIIIPKHDAICTNTNEILDLLEKFCRSPFGITFANAGFEEIATFIKASRETMTQFNLEKNDKVLFGPDLYTINTDPGKMSEYLMNIENHYKVIGIGPKYQKLKECGVINEIIMIARNLKNAVMIEKISSKSALHNLEDKNALSDHFILNSAGDYLKFFNFSSLDFKQIFISDICELPHKKYCLLVLYHLYERSMNIVKLVTTPDIDVDRFSTVLIDSISSIRKRIPRCDQAFDKIEKSVNLLKENFNGYYRDFITSQNNPGIIIENFVQDVAKQSHANLQTTRQFRQIIKFYQEQMTSHRVENPKVNKMVDLVQQNLDILDAKIIKKESGAKK